MRHRASNSYQLLKYQLTEEDLQHTDAFSYDESAAYIAKIGLSARSALDTNNFKAAIQLFQQQIACLESLQEHNGGLLACNEHYAAAAACTGLADIFMKKEWGFNRASDCALIAALYKKAINYVSWDIDANRANKYLGKYKAELKSHLSQFTQDAQVAALIKGDEFLVQLFESYGISMNSLFKPPVKKVMMPFQFKRRGL